MINLYNHQKRIIEFNPKRWLLCHGTGTGKTRTAIELVNKNNVSFLIICPKTLKENWKREIEKWLKIKTDWQVVTKEEFNTKTRREIGKALKDIKKGENLSPTFDNIRDAIRYLKQR